MKNIAHTFAFLAVLVAAHSNNACAQGTTAITYQGRPNTSGGPANGSYELSFAVYDATAVGNLVAGPITNTAVAVSNGHAHLRAGLTRTTDLSALPSAGIVRLPISSSPTSTQVIPPLQPPRVWDAHY